MTIERLAAMLIAIAGVTPAVAQPPVIVVPAPTAPSLVLPAPVADSPASPAAFNIHLVVTEEFLNRFIARREIEPGPVQEQMQDVAIQGEQCTITRVWLDLLPSFDQAYGRLVLDGDVQSRTTGVSDKATVHSVGHSQFHATKELFFNGEAISTRHAQIDVRTNNQNVGIQTRMDGTFFGPLANRMAARIAEQRKPQSEQLAKQRLKERVFPSFDGEVDNKLANANDQLETTLRATLRKYEVLPAAQRIVTTDQHLHYAAAIGDVEADVAIAPPKTNLVAPHAINLYLHERAINGLLDRLKLHGLKTTDRELRSLSARLKTLGRSTDAPAAEPSHGLTMKLDTEIEFDGVRPMWVELQREQLTLRIRAALRPMGQALLPPVEIAVPFRLVERAGAWQLVAGEIDVQAQPGGTGSGRLTDVTIKLIRDAIAGSLTEPQFPRELPIPSWPQDKPKLQLTSVRAADGWLALSLD